MITEERADRARELRLATAFGRSISPDAKRALALVARFAPTRDLEALAEEIHELSVRPAPPTAAQSHLQEWIT